MTRKLGDLIPKFVKPILRPLYRAVLHARLGKKGHPASLSILHQYWKNPSDSTNLPQQYLQGKARSQFLLKIMNKYATKNQKILEIGCNVGRNLNYLFHSGFKNLEGIEISEKAVQLLHTAYPEMAQQARIYNSPVEEIIRNFRDCEFDIVFTMAVLEHIHLNSEWIFPEIVRITKNFLITIEDEFNISWRCIPRNYKKVFEPLGMTQIEEINCREVDGLGSNFYARIFRRV